MLRGGGGATSRAYVDLRGELTYIRETGRERQRERERDREERGMREESTVKKSV